MYHCNLTINKCNEINFNQSLPPKIDLIAFVDRQIALDTHPSRINCPDGFQVDKMQHCHCNKLGRIVLLMGFLMLNQI